MVPTTTTLAAGIGSPVSASVTVPETSAIASSSLTASSEVWAINIISRLREIAAS